MKLAQTLALIAISAASGACITYIQIAPDAKPQRALETSIDEGPLHRVAENETCSFETKQPANLRAHRTAPKVEQSQKTAPETPNTSNEHQDLEVSLQQLRYQEAQVDSFRENIASVKSQSPLQAVKTQFQSQSVDYEWALRQEEKVLSLFESQTALKSYSPLDVSCKSETCQIVMAAETQQQGKVIYDAFLEANNQKSGAKTNTSVSYFNDPENGQLVMYTSEEGVEALFGQ